MKIIYKEIAEYTNKTEQGIKQMKTNNPKQLELLKVGALCKKYDISLNDIEAIIKLKENINNK